MYVNIYYQDEYCTLIHGKCLDVMPEFQDKMFDSVICDLPYGTIACKWDVIIPFEPLWGEYERIRKQKGAVVLFGSEPFSSKLRVSNLHNFKYDWIWNKRLAGNGILAKHQPLKIHEIISVFYSHLYYPQKTKGIMRNKMFSKTVQSELHSKVTECKSYKNDEYYPTSILDYSLAGLRTGRLHPTQKSLPLLEYLIKTYTKEGDIILDNCCGSGTTLVAAKRLKRKCWGIEMEEQYCEVTKQRLMKEDERLL
jgi:DNA modification methylase